MEHLIHEEIRKLCDKLDKSEGESLSMATVFNLSVINALWSILTGCKMGLDDPKLLQLMERFDDFLKEVGPGSIQDVFPAIRHIAPEWCGWNKTKRILGALIAIIQDILDQHQLHYEKNSEFVKDNPRDFIDAYLNEIDESETSSSFHGKLGLQSLRSVLFDLLLAGIETTSTALTWSVLFMVKYPEIQEKVRKEILDNVGPDRLVNIEDKTNLPYTEAVIQEILRYTCIAPLGLSISKFKK